MAEEFCIFTIFSNKCFEIFKVTVFKVPKENVSFWHQGANLIMKNNRKVRFPHSVCFTSEKKREKNEENFPELDIIMFACAVPGGGLGGLVPPLKFNI